MFSPDFYYSSVTAIDLAMLGGTGVRHLLVDLDNTLLPRDRSDVPAEVRTWIDSLPGHGMNACLVSNNWHAHVQATADRIGLPIVARSLKPFPRAFRRGLRVVGGTPDTTAIVGDQVFTDILGGNLVGLTTVLVRPQSASDLPHTLLLRRAERVVLAGREPLA